MLASIGGDLAAADIVTVIKSSYGTNPGLFNNAAQVTQVLRMAQYISQLSQTFSSSPGITPSTGTH